jgi:hypothetical protein
VSNIATIELEIKDLAAAKRAATRLGLEFREGQRTFRQHTTHGAGQACDHAIAVLGNPQAYEIGVIAKKGGTYELKYDYYGGGRGLMEKVSSGSMRDIDKYRQAYAVEVAIAEVRRLGYRYRETTDASGVIQVEAYVTA